jgi:hypothetical protein
MIEPLKTYLKEDKPFRNLGKGKKVKVKESKGSCKVNNKEWANRVKGILYKLVDAIIKRL